jgi:hypothetical protein
MDSREACRQINTMALRPGWTATAMPYSDKEVLVDFGLDTHNSNENEAPYYPFKFTRGDYKRIDVRDVSSRNELAAQVIAKIMEIEYHEWAEFLRYPDGRRWVAPFHPHRPEGNRAEGSLPPHIRALAEADRV